MKLTQQFLTQNDCFSGGRTMIPRGVMVHSTGVAQPSPQAFIRQWNKQDVPVCVHAFVCETGVIQTLPWNRRGWHAGTGTSGRSANNTHISFEICEPKGHTYAGGTMLNYDVAKNADYFAKIYQNAVDLTAMLCKEYRLNPLQDGVVICHSEGYRRGVASNHADVEQWFPKHGKTMDEFRADVSKAMKGDDDMTAAEVQKIVAETMGARLPEAIAAALKAHDALFLYKTLADIPQWGQETVKNLLTSGALKGDDSGNLNISHDLLRALVILGRMR
ncbi:MAG: N-acetylmuramoyl-L-alanine amidase [Oscillospiraceae bacterium]